MSTTSRGYPLMADNEGDKPQAVNDAVQAINDDINSLPAPAWSDVTDKPLDSEATPDTVIIRDAAGNAQVADPLVGADIATRNFVLSNLSGGPKGAWDASTNTPTLVSGVGTAGDYYFVSVAGTTTIDGISSWSIGDKIIFSGTAWQNAPNPTSDATISAKGVIKLANNLGGTADLPSVLSLTFPSSLILALGSIADGEFLMRSGTDLVGGRQTKRVTSITSSSTPAPNADTTDIYIITALTTNATFTAPSGTPGEGQMMQFRIKGDATPRTLTWPANFRAGADVALPTTTTASKTLYMLVQYNSADSKWDCLAVNNGF